MFRFTYTIIRVLSACASSKLQCWLRSHIVIWIWTNKGLNTTNMHGAATKNEWIFTIIAPERTASLSIHKSWLQGLPIRIKLAPQARSNRRVRSTLPSLAGNVFTDLQESWRHHNDLGYYFVARGAETNICWSLHQSERGSFGRAQVSVRVTQVACHRHTEATSTEVASRDCCQGERLLRRCRYYVSWTRSDVSTDTHGVTSPKTLPPWERKIPYLPFSSP